MSSNRKIDFALFRYQLLPVAQQLDMFFDTELKIEEIRKNKNIFFHNKISEISGWKAKTELNHKLIWEREDTLLLKLANKKTLNVVKKDFNTENIDSWPNIFILINNRPDIQTIAIQIDKNVFNSPSYVAKILEDTLNIKLNDIFLNIYIKPILIKNSFWQIVEKYKDSIIQIKFELISPNMSNISHKLELDLKSLNLNNNVHKTNIEMNSAKDTMLKVDRRSPLLNSMVEYAELGGGDNSIRLKNYRKVVKTNLCIKQIEVDEIILNNGDLNALKILLELE